MKTILTLLAFTGTYCGFSQQNLVQNPSFEFHDNDPSTYGNGDVGKAYYWFNDGIGTSDYFHSDFNNVIGRVPDNEYGTQVPHSGNAYAGIYTCQHTTDPNVREYIRNQFSFPLIAGNVYQVSFYASLADDCGIATSFGAKFSASPVTTFNGFLMLTTEDIHFNTVTDNQNWTLFTGMYTAAGGEQFLTIGNFFDDLNCDSVHLQNGYLYAYYYIDDVSVMQAGTAALEAHSESNPHIYPNPVSAVLYLDLKETAHVTVVNNLGDLVKSQNLHPDEPLNVADLAPGSYFLKIKDEIPVRFIRN